MPTMGGQAAQSRLASLSPEILNHIFSFMIQPDLRSCRLLNHYLSALAGHRLFRHMRLDGNGDVSAKRFIQVAASEKLRILVREVTCDTWLGPDFEYNEGGDYDFNEAFLKALRCLRFFTNLKSFSLRFSEFCGVGATTSDYGWGNDIEENNDFRYAVLSIIFHCLAGSWTADKHRQIEEECSFDDLYENESTDEEEVQGEDDGNAIDAAALNDLSMPPISLETITVSNLADFNDVRLTQSETFQAVINSGDIKTLKLLITTEDDSRYPGHSTYFPEKYDMFETLPQTWLAPALAQNLRVLSLYSVLEWGWHVNLDFRKVNPLAGSSAGFPNLRSLALGNYIFSQDWQVDWIASLGKENGRGGLEELYLDKCAVIHHAWHKVSFNDSAIVLGKDPSGQEVVIPGDGMPLKASFTQFMHHVRGFSATLAPKEKYYPLRWYQILHRWQEAMSGLRVFKIGRGSWEAAPPHTTQVNYETQPNEYEDSWAAETLHRFGNRFFIDYDCPSPVDRDFGRDDWENPNAKYLNGTGLCQDKDFQLEYIRFNAHDGSPEWYRLINDVYHNRPALEEEAFALDTEALEALLSSVEERSIRG